MQFHDFARSIWARLPLILLLAAVVVVLGLRGASSETRYTSQIPVLFSAAPSSSTSEIVEYGSTQLRSLAEIVTSSEVLEPVIDDLGLDRSVEDLAKDVDASVADDTFLLTISAHAGSGPEAEELVRAVATSLVDSSEDLTDSGLLRAAPLTPQTTATTVGAETSVQSVIKDLVIGLVIGVGLSVLLDLVDPRVRSRSEFARLTSLPVLAEVSSDPRAPYASIASRLALKGTDPDRRTVLILPSRSGESHVLAASRLGAELAGLSSSTVVVSSTSRSDDPSITSRAFTETFPTSRPQDLRDRLSALREEFGTVVIAAPSIDEATSSLLLASVCDISVLVIDERRDTRGSVLRTVAALREAGPPFACALLVAPRRLLRSRASVS